MKIIEYERMADVSLQMGRRICSTAPCAPRLPAAAGGEAGADRCATAIRCLCIFEKESARLLDERLSPQRLPAGGSVAGNRDGMPYADASPAWRHAAAPFERADALDDASPMMMTPRFRSTFLICFDTHGQDVDFYGAALGGARLLTSPRQLKVAGDFRPHAAGRMLTMIGPISVMPAAAAQRWPR